ncbi:MAG: tol-pal system protein YbgF [Nitrospira sp.]|nr:tol-pal system protein YbgF [Nitrospira sp.]
MGTAVLCMLTVGCVAQQADLRHTEQKLQEEVSQVRARQGQEIATLRDHDLPQVRGEVERALHLAKQVEAVQEDLKHRLVQLEQYVKKLDADQAARYAWIQKSFDTQDTKFMAKVSELSRAVETTVTAMKKDVIEAVQRTNETLAKRLNERLEEQGRETASQQQQLNQVSEKFVQFNQALTGFREALTDLHEQVQQNEQATSKSLETLSQNVQVLTSRVVEQDRRLEALVRIVESGRSPTEMLQQAAKSAPPSTEPLMHGSEASRTEEQRPEGREGGNGGRLPSVATMAETTAPSITIVPPKELPSDHVPAKAEPPRDRTQYEKVKALFDQGNFKAAREGFVAFLSEYPNSDLAPNARYWLGETYYRENDYQKAIEAYNQVEINYPNSEKVPDAIFKKGLAYLELKDRERAELAFKQVISLYPKSPQAGKASGRLSKLKSGR